MHSLLTGVLFVSMLTGLCSGGAVGREFEDGWSFKGHWATFISRDEDRFDISSYLRTYDVDDLQLCGPYGALENSTTYEVSFKAHGKAIYGFWLLDLIVEDERGT